jgi:PASTA domain
MITIAKICQGALLGIAGLGLAACGGSDSGGSNSVTVPNVVGDTQAAASTAITGAGLTVGTVTTQSSSSVASGDVISESPAAATTATQGSAVTLVVSSGPAPVSVPNVVGDTQAAASTAITGAGLTVGGVTMQSSTTVASGDVISENPAAAASVAAGSAVAIVVSSGPPSYTVGGTLIGLGASASVHVLNGSDSFAVSANGAFTLPTAVVTGKTYAVTVGTPTSTQTCAVQNGSGTVATANVTNVIVYCTYNVTTASLNGSYTAAVALLDDTNNVATPGVPADGTLIYTLDGNGNFSGTSTINYNGIIVPNYSQSGTYTVTTANAIPAFAFGSGTAPGGIEGLDGDAFVSVSTARATAPSMNLSVLPNTTATTSSLNGNYTLVNLGAQISNGTVSSILATITLTDGSIAGTYTQNSGGTITTGNTASGQWNLSGGVLTAVSAGTGALSANNDLIVFADTTSGDDPNITAAIPRGTGVTKATFEGVYAIAAYGGTPISAMFDEAITFFAYGDGTWSLVNTKNANGTITTNNTGSGTYTVAADGTLTITDASGDIYNGAITVDGNILALSSVAAQQNPAIYVGVRQ